MTLLIGWTFLSISTKFKLYFSEPQFGWILVKLLIWVDKTMVYIYIMFDVYGKLNVSGYDAVNMMWLCVNVTVF